MTGGGDLSKLQEPRRALPIPVVVVSQQEQETKNCNTRMNQQTLTPPLSNFFTPRRLLTVFCVINMLNYVDRGAIASNGVNGSPRMCSREGICSSGTGIQGNFNLNNFQDGVLSSSFMVGLLIASPIFASLTKNHNAFRLIGVGLSIWTLAAAGCGAAFNFWSIAVCRMFVGVGEASFVSLAAPFIDDNAPSAQKTAWLALFYMCIPTGIALGYVYGGYVGGNFSWRYAFWGEALLMAPFAILGFLVKPLDMKGFTPSELKRSLKSGAEKGASCENGGNVVVLGEKSHEFHDKCGFRAQVCRFWKDFRVLLFDKVYVVNVGGYIFYNFVIGAYSYWGPKAGYSIYGMKNADMVFGGITIACGILGTLSGGYFLDRMSATISNAFKILSGSTLLGAVFCFGAFCMRSLPGFIALFSIGELLVFATQAPVNFVCLHCVSPGLRPLSMAMSTVSIHVFGDVPSAPLVGVLQDNINNWRVTALILTSILFVAAGIWFVGIFIKCIDKFEQSSDDCISPVQNATMKPLLKGKQDVTPRAS